MIGGPSGSLPSVMNHNFSQVPDAQIPRSQFDRSKGYKTTFDAGYLVPVYCEEVLPGDTATVRMNCFARLATPKTPIMDNMYLDSFFFFVPSRLVWENWQKFNGEQVNPGDSTDYLVPQQVPPASTGYTVGTLADYFGIPTDVHNTGGTVWSVNALPFRAYNLIYNEWFRDQNLQDSVTVDLDDGPDDPADYVLLRRGRRHDYFTSCLPFPQKGPAVQLPLGTSAEVLRTPSAQPWLLYRGSTQTAATGQATLGTTAGGFFQGNTGNYSLSGDPKPDTMTASALYADLSTATAATINQLREAFQIQRLYERDARGGTRYIEILRSHFGVTSPDFRLQRPEYLGGGETPVNINPVPQTSESATTPQGNLTAFGTVSGSGSTHGFTKSFVEHGYIIGLISVRADLSYQQGLNRMWSRRTRFDFYWPALSHLGEQSVLNQEIYLQNDATQNEGVFGYQERYAEYRYSPALITGQFRSTYAQSLDVWHLATDYGSLPALNSTFIVDNPPVDRVIADTSDPHFLFDAYFSSKWARPMPVYSVPGLIDHF